MSNSKEDIKVLKGMVVPLVLGTILVVGIALLGRYMTEKKA